MNIPVNIKNVAKELRNNQTDTEKYLWDNIKSDKLWVRVLRQKIFYVYTEFNWQDRFIIPDFYIAKSKLIIEVDWWIHKVSDILKLDKIKEELIIRRWFKLLRFTNDEVLKNIEKVLSEIKKEI